MQLGREQSPWQVWRGECLNSRCQLPTRRNSSFDGFQVPWMQVFQHDRSSGNRLAFCDSLRSRIAWLRHPPAKVSYLASNLGGQFTSDDSDKQLPQLAWRRNMLGLLPVFCVYGHMNVDPHRHTSPSQNRRGCLFRMSRITKRCFCV